MVGALLGCPLGTPVGCIDGCELGCPVGCLEGCPVGCPVGFGLASAVMVTLLVVVASSTTRVLNTELDESSSSANVDAIVPSLAAASMSLSIDEAVSLALAVLSICSAIVSIV